jgi:hypothetical protein
MKMFLPKKSKHGVDSSTNFRQMMIKPYLQRCLIRIKKDELSRLIYTPNYCNGYGYYGQETYLNQNYTLANYKEMLIEDTEKLCSKLVEESAEDVIQVYPSRISSSSSSLPSLPVLPEELFAPMGQNLIFHL